MHHSPLAFGIGMAELIILLAIGGGVLLAGIICVVAIIASSKKSPPPVLPPRSSPEQRLGELNGLLAKQLITEAEYQERRAAIIKGL